MATLDFDNKISIVELTEYDVAKKTDVFMVAKNLIKGHEEKYPTIEKWFEKKVSNLFNPSGRILQTFLLSKEIVIPNAAIEIISSLCIC
jgi:hypothetical protein